MKNSKTNLPLDWRDAFLGARVLVTGNTGFKGAWLSQWLQTLGADVHGFSSGIPSEDGLFSHLPSRLKDQTFWGDICDNKSLTSVISNLQPQFIFHLAAQPIVGVSYEDPLETWRVNSLGTVSLLDSVRKSKVSHLNLVMITSDKVYRNHEWPWGYRENDELGGHDPYSASKGSAEFAIRSYFESYFRNSGQVRLASVRAGNVIGGGDWSLGRIVPDSIRAWQADANLKIRNPYSTRPWQHVLEPVSGYLTVAAKLHTETIQSGRAYNFGPESSNSRTVTDLLDEINKNLPNRKINIEVEPTPFPESNLLQLSSDQAKANLGWHPILNFEESVAWTAKWYVDVNQGRNPGEVSLSQILEYQARIGV